MKKSVVITLSREELVQLIIDSDRIGDINRHGVAPEDITLETVQPLNQTSLTPPWELRVKFEVEEDM